MEPSHPIRRATVIAIVAAPLLILLATFLGFVGEGLFRDGWQGGVQIVAMGAWMLAFVGMSAAVGGRSPALGATVLVLGAVGCAAGAGFGVDVLHASNGIERLEPDTDGAVLLFLTGLVYPLAIAAAGIALWRTELVSPVVGATLALGGLLFPVGRIPDLAPAVIASDLLILVPMIVVAARLNRVEVATAGLRSRAT